VEAGTELTPDEKARLERLISADSSPEQPR
jgi:hypothetical protein